MNIPLSKTTIIPLSRIILAAAAIATVLATAPATAADYTIRMSTESPTGSPNNVILSAFRDALQEELGDRVEIEFFEAGALGDEPLHLDMIRSGQIQAYPLGSDAVQLDPKWAIFDMPFLIPDRETASRLLDGEIGQELAASMRERADLEVLGLGEVGFRNITNSVRPVTKPEDLAGLRLRVPGAQTRITAFTMLGANPITMNMGELYLSLQQGTVDGQENPLSVIDSWSLYEVQDYVTLSRHVYSPVTLVMHGPTFELDGRRGKGSGTPGGEGRGAGDARLRRGIRPEPGLQDRRALGDPRDRRRGLQGGIGADLGRDLEDRRRGVRPEGHRGRLGQLTSHISLDGRPRRGRPPSSHT